MTVERFGKRFALVPSALVPSALVTSALGAVMLASPSVALSQQQQGQAQQQRQGDVQVAVAPGAQQPAQPMIWNEVRIVKVKGDRVGEFEGLLKELADVMSERNEPYAVWQVAFGPQNTYHMAAQLESLGSLAGMAENPPMEPQQWANWVNRIESTIDSQEVAIAQIHPDLSIMPGAEGSGAQGGGQSGGQAGGQAGAQSGGQAAGGAQAGQTPELLILMSQTLLPGMTQEYRTWLRDEMLPALRETDLTAVVTNEMAFGSEGRTWVFAVPIENWAALDEPMPLYDTMGPQAAEELMARGDAMVDRSETIVLRTRPDLSVGAPGGQQQLGQQSGQQRSGQQAGQRQQ